MDTIEHKWEDTRTAGVRTTDCVAAGAGRLCTDLSTQVEVIIMGAGAVTGFPLLKAVLPTPVEAQLLCAEVRAGDGGGAVIIADTPICKSTRAVHLSGAGCANICVCT